MESEVAFLVPLLPHSARVEMLGDNLGMSQIPSKAAQDNFIHRLLKSRAGTDGSKIAAVRLALSVIGKYGATTLHITDPSERDEALFPMSGILANQLIHSEDERALLEAKGKRKGATVGPRFLGHSHVYGRQTSHAHLRG